VGTYSERSNLPENADPAWQLSAMPLQLLLFTALLAVPAMAMAGSQESCWALLDERNAIGERAMQVEIDLVKQTRRQLCPKLEQQAEGANALTGRFEPVDYEALLQCRHRAERRLARNRPVLYRNRQAFIFYTSEGARLARQADALTTSLQANGCQAAGPTPGLSPPR
jgi:hypothetical protein